MKLNRKNRKAFTIVELVIVVGVIGILSAILIPTFANLTSKAQESALKSDLAAVYASYVADAADGYVGDTTSGTALNMYNQDKVAISKVNTGTPVSAYKYTNGSGWSTNAVNITVANTSTNYQLLPGGGAYNGYYVYYQVA